MSLTRTTSSLIALIVVATGCIPVGSSPPTLIPRDERATWVGVGLGATTVGFLGQMDASTIKDGRVLRARWNGSTYDAYATELAILAGRGRICCGGSNWVSFAIGGAVVTGAKGNFAPEFTTVGLAGELLFVTGRFPHPSVALLGNLNPKLPFFGVNVFIPIGRQPFTSTAAPSRPRRRPF